MFVPNPNGGKALRESTKQRDDVAAHRVYLERVRAPLDGPAAQKERSLEDALLARIEWLEANQESEDPTRKKLAKDTIDFYKKKSGVLVRLLGAETPLSQIDAERIREYIVERTKEGAKGTSISKELTALSMAVKMAHKDGVACHLVRDIKPDDFKAEYVPKERWLTREEYGRFMSWWYANRDPHRGATLDFITATGATFPSEVVRAIPGDVRVKEHWVHLRGTKRETRDRKFIVPLDDARELLARAMKHAKTGPALFLPWGNVRREILIACAYVSMCQPCRVAKNLWWHDPQTGAWNKGAHQVMGRPARDPGCKRCKTEEPFEPFSPTDLRRTFAQWMMQAGIPYELAYPITGHVDDRMLKKVYGRRSALDVAPLIDAFLKRGKR
jgi:integrase